MTPAAEAWDPTIWLRMAGVSLAYVMLFGTGEALQRKAGWDPEFSRKVVHVGAGLLALPLPLLFDARWPVFMLAAAFVALLAGARSVGLLGSIHGVRRASAGAYLYPVGVALAFAIADGIGYAAAVLSLCLADAAAWAVGSALGRWRYAVAGNVRTVEGSLAALVCAATVATLLLLWAGTPTAAALLVGLDVGLAVALVEAVSPYGSDNLTVPLAAAVVMAGAGSVEMRAVLLLAPAILGGIALYMATRPVAAGRAFGDSP